MRGGLVGPGGISIAAEQCAIIFSSSIFPHCRSVAGCSLSIRATTSSAVSCSNRFLILPPKCCGLSGIIALLRGELVQELSNKRVQLGRFAPDEPLRQSRGNRVASGGADWCQHEPSAVPCWPFGSHQLHRPKR